MSNLAVLELSYESPKKISVPDIVAFYLKSGWNLNDFGNISLRPLGDKDDFNWVKLGLNQETELFDIIQKKVEANEDPAVVLMLDEMEVGVVTTFFPKERRINFLLNIGRKTLQELPSWTDINWYLIHVSRPLLENGIIVSKVEYSESP
jgi:hypothetical protein